MVTYYSVRGHQTSLIIKEFNEGKVKKSNHVLFLILPII